MPASESGGVITQTGTETDLSFLNGINGISVDASGRNYYVQAGFRFVQQGTMTIIGDDNTLIFDPLADYPNYTMEGASANLTFGKKKIVGNAIRYSGGVCLEFLREAPNLWNTGGNGAFISQNGGGNITGYGGTISSASPISFIGRSDLNDTGTINIESLRLNCINSSLGTQVRFDSVLGQTINVKGLVLDGDPNSFRALFSTDFTSFEATLVSGNVQMFAAQLQDLVFSNFITSGNVTVEDFLLNNNKDNPDIVFYLRDFEEGTGIFSTGGPGVGGAFGFESTFKIKVVDHNDANLQDSKTRIVETLDGNESNPKDRTGFTWDQSATHLLTSDSNGEGEQVVLIGTARTPNETVYTKSFRSANGTNDDVFATETIHYTGEIISATPALKGVGGVTQNIKHFPDPLIIETDKATVDAYPITISLVGSDLTITGNGATLQALSWAQFYDALKAHLWDIWDTYTGASETIVTRTGETIDARDLNVILDFITFTGSITTTGTVTLQNGSTVSGGIIDANGDSFLTFESIDSWIVYANAADRDANSNQLDSGSGIYRFNFSGGTTYYIRAVRNGVTFFLETTPAAAGETVVSLSTEALLASSGLPLID